jgi:hypothetical protein
MRPGDAYGFREAWAILERLWEVTRARALARASCPKRCARSMIAVTWRSHNYGTAVSRGGRPDRDDSVAQGRREVRHVHGANGSE